MRSRDFLIGGGGVQTTNHISENTQKKSLQSVLGFWPRSLQVPLVLFFPRRLFLFYFWQLLFYAISDIFASFWPFVVLWH